MCRKCCIVRKPNTLSDWIAEKEYRKDIFKTNEKLYELIQAPWRIDHEHWYYKLFRKIHWKILGNFNIYLGNKIAYYITRLLAVPWLPASKIKFLRLFYKNWDYYLATKEWDLLLIYKVWNTWPWIVPYYIIKENNKKIRQIKYKLDPIEWWKKVIVNVPDGTIDTNWMEELEKLINKIGGAKSAIWKI